ncbi:hypothetical protein, partial [Bradyrhizobium rifense]|uniref:hypothetical protein n=1 Tax=Bradyrhizobium rifense TaxID=515499 RepID=UPI001AED8877
MDDFQQDCAHVTNQFLAEPANSTSEDRGTRKRWARGVIAFYACVMLAGATAIAVTQHVTSPEQHASLQASTTLAE